MSNQYKFHNTEKEMWITYTDDYNPAAIHVIFASEFQNLGSADIEWREGLTTKAQGLRLNATKQALKNCKVEEVIFLGTFNTDPDTSHSHIFSRTNLWDVLRTANTNQKAVITRLVLKELGAVKSAVSGSISMADIFQHCSSFIAEDILNFEAEYYARRHEKNYILPGDYEEVLNNMEMMTKNELLYAAENIAAGMVPEKDRDIFEEVKNKSFINARPLKSKKLSWEDVANVSLELDEEISKNKLCYDNDTTIASGSHADMFTKYDIPDSVNHPQHYKSSNGLETIDCIEAFTEELPGDLGYCVGNAIKYLCRFNKKGKPVEDLEKAKWYVNRAIENVKKREE